jgi:hypothetical protein
VWHASAMLRTILLSFFLIACGDDDGGTDAGPSGRVDGGPRDAGNSDDDAGDREDGGADDDAGSSDAGERDATTEARVTLTEFVAFANCKPVVPPDPIITSWTATVSGAAGATATLTNAELTITGGETFTQTVTVDNPVIALTGGAGSAMQRKVSGTPAPTDACERLCAVGSSSELEATFSVDGANVLVTATGTFECAL